MRIANDDGGTALVLIVDDCPDTRRLVATSLGAISGVVAEEAGDLWSALRMMVKRVPDVLILDMDLPRLSGYQTTRMVRAWGGRFADLPILAITAAPSLHTHTQCLDAGANDFMAKPLSPTTLRMKVRAALGHANESSFETLVEARPTSQRWLPVAAYRPSCATSCWSLRGSTGFTK